MKNYSDFEPKKSYTVDEAMLKLMNYCVYQDRCHKEVEQKLYDMNMFEDARNQIILKLIEEDFLNESRFAKSFARGKFRIKKWGKIRIVRELKMKNISAFNIKLALKEIPDEDYFSTLNDLAEKRWNDIKDTSILKKKKKLANYLFYRGWESQLVYEKIHELASAKK
ncbi:regulatory protein RecX [Psychroflexus aestuariivivens]|uniref:regulatory protein RecX n=1 Tax=Psychroflexus aestuariivivens TaxID=1795040 RepID=UPI000FDA5C82|nr:regulatory protein RecX [Psychroflexus aestuariivivens]